MFFSRTFWILLIVGSVLIASQIPLKDQTLGAWFHQKMTNLWSFTEERNPEWPVWERRWNRSVAKIPGFVDWIKSLWGDDASSKASAKKRTAKPARHASPSKIPQTNIKELKPTSPPAMEHISQADRESLMDLLK